MKHRRKCLTSKGVLQNNDGRLKTGCSVTTRSVATEMKMTEAVRKIAEKKIARMT